jgi:uncharacterized protein
MATPNIESILKNANNIAIVGLSEKPYRDSYMIAQYLLRYDYNIIPVNPTISEWEGVKSYPDLLSVPGKVDMVNVFRRSKFVAEIAEQAIRIAGSTLWLQYGIYDDDAVKLAEEAGLDVIVNKCIKVEHMFLAKP